MDYEGLRPSALDKVLAIAASFDPIDRIEGAISTFKNADWRNAWRKRGMVGIAREFVSSVVSHNAPTIHFSRGSRWRGIDVERLLFRHGVKVWDRGVSGYYELYFCVKRRQVRWAEYVLRRHGVPVTSIEK